jgi:two-component system, OmpR family, KDP operon response regulator KdpE
VTETRARVLIIEDEPSIVKVLGTHLAASGYEISTASTAQESIQSVAQSAPDVILLDLGLPDQDGKDVIPDLRRWTDAPIVVLSARHEEEERISALDLGADDYVTKPFRMGELQARLRAALRRAQTKKEAPKAFSAGGLEIDFDRRAVKMSGELMRLTRKEYDLLACLAHHAGQVVTHKQLLAAGWGGAMTDTQFVRVYIGQLRQKIEADPSAPALILTEPGIGYRLRADD